LAKKEPHRGKKRFDYREVLIIKDFGIPCPVSFQLMLKNQLKGLRREMKCYSELGSTLTIPVSYRPPTPKSNNIFKKY
jgi:hypothetical protein